MPRCAMLCHAVTRCAALCHAVLRCATLCYSVLCCATLRCGAVLTWIQVGLSSAANGNFALRDGASFIWGFELTCHQLYLARGVNLYLLLFEIQNRSELIVGELIVNSAYKSCLTASSVAPQASRGC